MRDDDPRDPDCRDDVARDPEERDVEVRVLVDRDVEPRAPDERAPEPLPDERPDAVAPPRAAPDAEPFEAGRPVLFGAPFAVLFGVFFEAPWAPPDVVLRVPPDDRPVPAEPVRPAPERAPDPREVPAPRRPSSARATGHPSVSIVPRRHRTTHTPTWGGAAPPSPGTRRVARTSARYTWHWA